jgi:spore maturation protein CgeB
LKFDLYGIDKVQPIWGSNFIDAISNSKMGVNFSRGKPVKYYSSDRIVQLIGNGLLTFIHKDTYYQDFFANNEMIFYNNDNDLIEKLNKYSRDDKLRKRIANKGRDKYHKHFNSSIVSRYMINKTLNVIDKNKYIWV